MSRRPVLSKKWLRMMKEEEEKEKEEWEERASNQHGIV